MLLLQAYRPDQCCLCGSKSFLTGEHKIKASLIREEFGSKSLYIGNPDQAPRLWKYAQGPKSKSFHFENPLCRACNGSLTQPSDKAFSEYHQLAKSSIVNGDDEFWSKGVFNPPGFRKNEYKSECLFRYFSKIICCRIAESKGPIFRYIAKHAIGSFDQNRIWLFVRKNPRFDLIKEANEFPPYAAHGGLIVHADKKYFPNAFHSSISIGPVQYVFWFEIHRFELIEMQWQHKRFFDWCIDSAKNRNLMDFSTDDISDFGL